MNKILVLLFAWATAIAPIYAQFTVYTPPVSIVISDIEYNATLGDVVVASDAGVLFFDGASWTQTTTANGLPSNDVKCIATTPAGAVLAGTASGLAKWNGTSWIPYTLNTVQTFSYVSAIFVRPGIDTTYGTNNGKLLKKGVAATAVNITFTPAVGLFTHIGYMNPPAAYDFIIGASTNGAVIYDIPTTSTFVVNTGSTPIPSNNILSHDIAGNKSYDGTDQGVYIPDFTSFPSMTSVIYNTGNSQLPSNLVQAIALRSGVQWYGTANGLAKLVGTTWTIYNTGNSNLPSNNVTELSYDLVTPALWIGTGDGKLSRIDLSLGEEEVSGAGLQVSVFPNPANESLVVALSSIEGRAEVVMCNAIGEKVGQWSVVNGENWINLKELAPGIYFVKVSSANCVITKKLIKQ